MLPSMAVYASQLSAKVGPRRNKVSQIAVAVKGDQTAIGQAGAGGGAGVHDRAGCLVHPQACFRVLPTTVPLLIRAHVCWDTFSSKLWDQFKKP